MRKLFRCLSLCLCVMVFSQPLAAQKKKAKSKSDPKPVPETTYDENLYSALEWRNVGPWRGGRSCAVTGVPGKPNLFYFGAAGGGIWRTEDGGRSWENLSDGFFGGSIGSIAVSASDHNVIYVGGGEKTVRGNVSFGYGVWKSEDAGKTWKQMGLSTSRHISRIRVHPQNHNIVYAAVMGNLFASSEERGVYKSIDGGENWTKVLFVNEDAGAVDLCLDPNNPRIMYASTWRIRRTPYSLSSGGEGCGLWKSTDSGETWEEITANEGLPKGTLGIIGVTVSPVNSERVWAIIESKDGGVFRSENGGETWKKINSERKLRQRAWYYTRIYADPQDEDVVYVMNVRFHKSKDGGKTFSSYRTPHGDHHDLWIAPENPKRIIVGDDGGAQITYDGGETWSTYQNQPTSQFYRVTTDDAFPYRIYAAQQDNSTIRIRHRSFGGAIDKDDWESTAGCECGHIAIDPRNNDIVYGGCYDGLLERKDHRTDLVRSINVWPDNPMGHGAEGMRYRFQWNFPLFFSPHDPKKLYAASNHLHVTTNEGQSWEMLSPDLTRNDSSRLVSSGGPITQDNTSVEYYCTIFAAVESTRIPGLIWTGSDDGLIHLTRDGGQNWTNVTPPDLPEWSMINSLEADPFEDGGAYVAATRYKLGDFQPLLYRTKDFGKTWTKIVDGIDEEHFTRVVRTDPDRAGLLYAGTESGVYVSYNDGQDWQPLQLNLPVVPITDLVVKNKNLIAATQGRSLWIIDDLSVLHQLNQSLATKDQHLFRPMDAYRVPGFQSKNVKNRGQNHPGGVMVHYYLKELADTTEVALSFLDEQGEVIKTYSNKAKEKRDQLKVEAGANRWIWNMNYPPAAKFKGMILWWASLSGPKALPGNYRVRLSVNGVEEEQPFAIIADPRSEATTADLQAQFDFISSNCDKITEAHQTIVQIRDIRKQMKNYTNRLPEETRFDTLRQAATAIDSVMTAVEENLYQTKNESPQDPLNFPIRLTNKLGHLNSLSRTGDYPPTAQAIAVRDELVIAIDAEINRFRQIVAQDLPAFNQLVRTLAVDAIILKDETQD